MKLIERCVQKSAMKKAILEYYQKVQNLDYNYCQYEDYSNVDDEIKAQFQHGKAPVRRNTKTDFKVFKDHFGYELPQEIQDYINLFWHSYIVGFIDGIESYTDEAIDLFQVIKYKNENDNDMLYHECGIMYLAEHREKYEKDTDKYIPVGWTDYYGSDILYEVKTGKIFCDFYKEKVQIADSLTQLIIKLKHRIL